MPRKQPKQRYQPSLSKEPKAYPVPTATLTIHWSFALFDGSLDWHDRGYREEAFRKVAKYMKDYEGLTWSDIEKRDHRVTVDKIILTARKRLRELQMDDIDELWRFRFSGARRIWGIRDQRLFKVIWWDPQHKICPSTIRHT